MWKRWSKNDQALLQRISNRLLRPLCLTNREMKINLHCSSKLKRIKDLATCLVIWRNSVKMSDNSCSTNVHLVCDGSSLSVPLGRINLYCRKNKLSLRVFFFGSCGWLYAKLYLSVISIWLGRFMNRDHGSQRKNRTRNYNSKCCLIQLFRFVRNKFTHRDIITSALRWWIFEIKTDRTTDDATINLMQSK